MTPAKRAGSWGMRRLLAGTPSPYPPCPLRHPALPAGTRRLNGQSRAETTRCWQDGPTRPKLLISIEKDASQAVSRSCRPSDRKVPKDEVGGLKIRVSVVQIRPRAPLSCMPMRPGARPSQSWMRAWPMSPEPPAGFGSGEIPSQEARLRREFRAENVDHYPPSHHASSGRRPPRERRRLRARGHEARPRAVARLGMPAKASPSTDPGRGSGSRRAAGRAGCAGIRSRSPAPPTAAGPAVTTPARPRSAGRSPPPCRLWRPSRGSG